MSCIRELLGGRVALFAAILALAASGESLAVGINDYQLTRSFALPPLNPGSGGQVLFDPLPDGRLLLLNASQVSVETAPKSGLFNVLGNIPGYAPSFGPSFLAVSPDGTHAAAGTNGAGTVTVFDTSDPSNPASVTNFAISDSFGDWIDNQFLAVANFTVANGTGVQVLDTTTHGVKQVIANIGGASAGVAFDTAGNLYTGNGFDSSAAPSGTGWIKAFSAAAWQSVTTTPLDFETTGTPIADLLSAYPVGFDSSGNMFVGGGDTVGGPNDIGFATLVDSGAVSTALAGSQTTPPITSALSTGVLRKFFNAPGDETQSTYMNFNKATGELYLTLAYGNGIVSVYAVPEPGTLLLVALGSVMFLFRRRCNSSTPRWAIAAAVLISAHRVAEADSPYATELISQNGAYGGASLYNDPNAVLGEPTRIAANDNPGSQFHVSLVQAAQNHDLAGNNVITTLSRTSNGAGGFTYGSITVKFEHPVLDDPVNPYGIDLNVFGNSFYAGGGTLSDATDMRTYNLAGIFAEPVVISVSPDNINWYTYASGPYGDTPFPTQGYAWSAAQHDATGNGWTNTATDFTKPVNPTLNSVLSTSSFAAADAMSTYVDAGGGTGIDLAPSGFGWIQYVRVESTLAHQNGEIDAFADVRPATVGEALSITADNVAANTPLYFQNAQNPTHTAVVAKFTAASAIAKLSTTIVTDSTALAALPNGTLLSTYQLDVQSLIGTGEIDFTADYQLSPGPSYAGSGAGLELLDWDGTTWQPVAYTFDSLTGRIIVDNWTSPNATLAILDTAAELAGDFNHDGRVDAADYVAGRKTLGSSYFNGQYALWRANYGKSLGQNEGAGAALASSVVPEPGAFALVALGAIVSVSYRGCRA